MCDFAAAAVRGDELLLSVVELKKGAAHRDSVEQLQAGLDLLERNLPAGPLPKHPAAYLVAGKLNAQLKHIVRGKPATLRFGQHRIRPQIHRCGDRLQM